MTASLIVALVLAAAGAPTAQTALEPGVSFAHHDWQLVCDNTRTCRAAGYQAWDARPPVSLLLTRAAGPGKRVHGRVRLSDFAPDTPALAAGTTVHLRIDGQPIASTTLDENLTGTLSTAAVRALVHALVGRAKIQWLADGQAWTLSTHGAAAVLRNMDAAQGRVGTPGALVSTGGHGDSQVLPALPMPVVTRLATRDRPLTLTAAQIEQLRAELLQETAPDGCLSLRESSPTPGEPSPIEVIALSASQRLASTQCWFAAYNSGRGYWVINAAAPYDPQRVTLSGSGYDHGVISSRHKGRGLGDCLSGEAWTWTARGFVQTSAWDTGKCRAIAAGGAWLLPSLVTEVVDGPAAPAQSASTSAPQAPQPTPGKQPDANAGPRDQSGSH